MQVNVYTIRYTPNGCEKDISIAVGLPIDEVLGDDTVAKSTVETIGFVIVGGGAAPARWVEIKP